MSELDVQDVIDFLTDLLGPVSDVVVVGAGAWSTGFGFSTAEGRQVGRFGQYRGDFEKDRIAGFWAYEGLPIPRVSDVGEAFEGYYAISEHCPGVPLESLDARGWASVLPSLVTALDRLRSIAPTDAEGFGGWGPYNMPFPSWRAFMLAVVTDEPERRTHGWTDKLRAHEAAYTTFERGYQELEALTDWLHPEPNVVHADLLERNVHVADGRIAGIFDWGSSHLGDFVYDLAWLEFWSTWYPAMSQIDVVATAQVRFAESGANLDNFAERMQCALIHIGLDHLAYHAWTGNRDALEAVDQRLRGVLSAH